MRTARFCHVQAGGNTSLEAPSGERLCNRCRSSRSSTSSISIRQHSHLIMSAEDGASVVFIAQPFRTVDYSGQPFVPSLQFPEGRIREQLRRARRRDQSAEGNGRTQEKDRLPSPNKAPSSSLLHAHEIPPSHHARSGTRELRSVARTTQRPTRVCLHGVAWGYPW